MSNIILKRLLLLLSLFFSIIYLINGTSYVFHWIDTGGVFYSLVSTQMISYIIFATLLLFSVYINHFSIRQRYQSLESCLYSVSLDLSTTYLLLIPIYGLSYSISIVAFNELTEVGSLSRILCFLSDSSSVVSKMIPGMILFITSLSAVLVGRFILSRRFIR